LNLSALRSTLRWLPLLFGAAVALLWLSSIAFVWLEPVSPSPVDPTQLEIPAAPDWRDALLVRIAITDTAIQEQRGVVHWHVDQQIARAPFSVVADGRIHTIVIPIGLHTEWMGDPQNLQIVFPRQNELNVFLAQASLLKRPPFALDALLGRVLTPLAVTLPDFRYLILLTAFFVSICLAVAALPISGAMPGRVLIASLATVCAIAAVGVVIEQARLLPPLWQRFASLDESTAALYVPHYAESAQVNQLLVKASGILPEGEVIVFDASPATSYLKVRAFYLLYSRQVSFAAPRPGRPPSSAVGIIQPATGRPPAPGWIRAAGPLAGLEAWRAPTGDLPAGIPQAGLGQFPWGLLATLMVAITGFGVSSSLGWQELRSLASALTFGALLTAWWMTLLSLAAIPWSLASVGVPLVVLGGSLIVFARRGQNRPSTIEPPALPQMRPRIHLGVLPGIGVIGFLLACLIVQAGVSPFGDQDSWTTWGFNSRALYSEGSVLRFLDRYAGDKMNHPSYPPGLPLLNAWSYLALGGVSERFAKLTMPLWWLSLIGLIWCEARRLPNTWLAVGLCLLAATTPIFLDHGTLGNADLPFTVALTVAAVALTRWIAAGDRRELAGAVLSLGAASWLKLDGIYLGMAFITCAALARWLYHRSRGNLSARDLVGQTAFALLTLIALYAPWLWLTRNAGVAAETPATTMLAVTGLDNLERGLRVLISELLFSDNNSTWSLLGAEYLLLWPICVAIILAKGWQKRRNGPFLFLVAATLLTVAFYVLIYVVRPFFSIERYVMHAAPLALLAAIRAMEEPSRVETSW
jgi:hypothetical protein